MKKLSDQEMEIMLGHLPGNHDRAFMDYTADAIKPTYIRDAANKYFEIHKLPYTCKQVAVNSENADNPQLAGSWSTGEYTWYIEEVS